MLLFKTPRPGFDIAFPLPLSLTAFPPVDIRGTISVRNHLESVTLGAVRASGVRTSFRSDEFEQRLGELLAARAGGLSEAEDAVRRSARDMLRNGTYKPTGRGKPASEYLLRAAADPASFPRINWPVDVCNYVSLQGLLPVSIWDLDNVQGSSFTFRLGRPGEEYVFNKADQVIQLADLVVGCEVTASSAEVPIVNPIKDSMTTKTSSGTQRVAACVYAPVDFSVTELKKLCSVFADLLGESCSESHTATHAIVLPGEEATL